MPERLWRTISNSNVKKAFYDEVNDTLYVAEIEGGELQGVLAIDGGLTFDFEEETEDAEEESEEETGDSIVSNIRRETRLAAVSIDEPKKRSITCKKCGKTGHFAKTCPAQPAVLNPIIERMRDLYKQGLTDEEIYFEVHNSVTDAQFRTYLESAKS